VVLTPRKSRRLPALAADMARAAAARRRTSVALLIRRSSLGFRVVILTDAPLTRWPDAPSPRRVAAQSAIQPVFALWFSRMCRAVTTNTYRSVVVVCRVRDWLFFGLTAGPPDRRAREPRGGRCTAPGTADDAVYRVARRHRVEPASRVPDASRASDRDLAIRRLCFFCRRASLIVPEQA